MQNDRQVRSSRTRLASTIEQFRQKLEADKAARIAAQNHDLQAENAGLRQRVELLTQIDSLVLSPPDWTYKPKAKGALHRGIPTLMLSDWHFDEVVNAEEMGGVNEYNREIALDRLKYTLSGTITELRKRRDSMKFEGFNLILGGDMFSGNIHEELKETNADTILGSLDFWVDPLAAFIGGIREEFGNVHVLVIPGNHGRNTQKPRYKHRARDNFDWVLGRILARHFRNDSKITWQIPESPELILRIYDTRYKVTHGDEFKGGSGISGMLAPLMLANARSAIQGMALNEHHDWMVVGHFHTYWSGLGVIVNGSGKGYDEMAKRCKFRPERPQQAMWITVPENIGPTYPQGIFATKEWLKKYNAATDQ